jgi:hypothetical protein
VLVTHAYNPSYSGGRDQEGRGLKPARAKSSRDLSQKTHHKTGLIEWLKVKALSSNPPSTEKNIFSKMVT